ncbi:DUF397 domain-containing protein [Spirillospora sp. NPDC127200]
MTETRFPSAGWRKSSRSVDQGNECVEVAAGASGESVMARDSMNPSGPILALSQHAWGSLLRGVKQGSYDLA